MTLRTRRASAVAGLCFLAMTLRASAGRLSLEKIRLPAGFRISVYASDVPDARELVLAPDGTIFVSSRQLGNVYAITNSRRSASAEEVIVIARGLHAPNGIAYRAGALFVAETDRIWRYDNILANLRRPPSPVLIFDKLPSESWHGWRYIGFGPDGWLYVSVGAPCNTCEPDFSRYAGIFRLRPDGSGLERFATGVRDSVGFDWDPETRELWFTDNGRDLLGDDSPPDELNHARTQGLNFGFPYCFGGHVSDPEFGRKHACGEFEAPVVEFPAHVATLGMRFYSGRMFPERYRHAIFIAEHGSWNRTRKIGYRIACVHLKGGKPVATETFAEGWLEGERYWGRPVDVQPLPDGSLLVSDDSANAIYRITFGP